LLGSAGAAVVAAAVVVSAFSGLNASMMTGSRVFFAMADRGVFLRSTARVSPRFNTPSVAIWLATALGVGYVLENDFAQLADKFILGIWPFYALTVGGVFMLRRRRPELPRPYRVWGYPLVPAQHRCYPPHHPGRGAGVLAAWACAGADPLVAVILHRFVPGTRARERNPSTISGP
jgi:amino acid transporter